MIPNDFREVKFKEWPEAKFQKEADRGMMIVCALGTLYAVIVILIFIGIKYVQGDI